MRHEWRRIVVGIGTSANRVPTRPPGDGKRFETFSTFRTTQHIIKSSHLKCSVKRKRTIGESGSPFTHTLYDVEIQQGHGVRAVKVGARSDHQRILTETENLVTHRILLGMNNMAEHSTHHQHNTYQTLCKYNLKGYTEEY